MVLGIFIPLIVTNCIVLARIEAFASKNPALHSALDGFAMGLGLTAVLAVLGGMREIFGHGTLLSGIDLVFGEAAKSWVITVVPNYHGFLLAILPPGAFITLGMLIAGEELAEPARRTETERRKRDHQAGGWRLRAGHALSVRRNFQRAFKPHPALFRQVS